MALELPWDGVSIIQSACVLVKVFVQGHIANPGPDPRAFDCKACTLSSLHIWSCHEATWSPAGAQWGREGTGVLGQTLTFLDFFTVSFSSCFFSWLACPPPHSTPCLWYLFFHPQQNNSHQVNWWWGVWEKQELLHWDDGPPHGGYEFSERCSTLSSTLTLTFFSPLLFLFFFLQSVCLLFPFLLPLWFPFLCFLSCSLFSSLPLLSLLPAVS